MNIKQVINKINKTDLDGHSVKGDFLAVPSNEYFLSSTTVINHVDSTYPWYDVIKMILYYCSILPKAYNLSLIMIKISDKSQLKDILQNIWTIALKTDKFIKNKESQEAITVSRNLETCLRMECGIMGGIPENFVKRHSVKATEIWIKYGY